MTTKVAHVRRGSYDVYIGRGSPWGNPYRIEGDLTRERVIELYKEYFWRTGLWKKHDLLDLQDKVLGCYCAPLACHGDFLAAVADEFDPIVGFLGSRYEEEAYGR